MEDKGTFFGRHFCGHGRLGDLLQLEIGFEAFLIKSQGFPALAIEIQVGIYLRHGGRFCPVKLPRPLVTDGVWFRQFKGLFTTTNGVIFIIHPQNARGHEKYCHSSSGDGGH